MFNLFRPLSARVVAVAAAVLAVAVAIPALTSADSARTITVQDKVRAVKIIDVAPKSKRDKFSQGDRVLTRQAMFDTNDRRIGTLFTDCAGVGPTAPLFGGLLQCTSTWQLRRRPSGGRRHDPAAANPDARFPIVGGSGAYRGASGEAAAGASGEGLRQRGRPELD